MKPERSPNLAASVRERLLNRARERGGDFQVVLARYAIERLLFRLGTSRYRDRFVLKGAMLFALWTDEPFRPTRDLDLLGYGENSANALTAAFRELCELAVEPDGLVFDARSVRVEPINAHDEYVGVRVRLTAELARARIVLQVDVGFGDAVTPQPTLENFPTLLSMPAPRVLAYHRETVVAEKLQAMVELGMTNSRMKDFFDVHMLAARFEFDGATLREALRQTFARRSTPAGPEEPVAFLSEFVDDPAKQVQWSAFLRKSGVRGAPAALGATVREIRTFLWPVLESVARAEPFTATWRPGGPWHFVDRHSGDRVL